MLEAPPEEACGADYVAAARARLDARVLPEATCRVALQLPDKRLVEKFAPEDTIQSLYDVVRVALPGEKAGTQFQLVAASHDAGKLDDMTQTVAAAGLSGAMLRLAWL